MGGVSQSKSAADRSGEDTIWLHYTGETVGPFNRSIGHRVKIFEESVTFVAQLDPEEAMVPPLDRNWMIGSWRIPEHQIPVIVGVSLGVLFLLLAIALLIIWRCCRLNRLREKAQYPTDNNGEEGRMPAPNSVSSSSYPSLVMMPIPSKPGSPTLTARSQTEINCETVRLTTETYKVSSDIIDGRLYIEEQLPLKEERRSCEDMSQVGYGHYVAFDLPEFETSMSNSTSSDDVTWAGSTCVSEHPDFKTRSLPLCAKNKTLAVKGDSPPNKGTRKACTVDGRVKHRREFRHQAAAVIALSKSSSSTRVPLVSHNEAVIVFNERTAL